MMKTKLLKQLEDKNRHYHAKDMDNEDSSLVEYDKKLELCYRPVFSVINELEMQIGVLSEDNRKFLRTLKRHGYLIKNYDYLISQPIQLTRKIIEGIVRDLDYDSDLWSDIFVNDDICRSVYSTKDIKDENEKKGLSRNLWNREKIAKRKKKASIDYYMTEELLSQFNNETDCRKYISSRIRVFKFYIYLRRCAILYRDTRFKRPLKDLLTFLKDKKNYQWLKDKLRVSAVGFKGENWNSGLHEWLTCDETLLAIKRTAGMEIELGVESHLPECIWQHENKKKPEYFCPEFNWLDLQLLLRTPNKYVAFRSARNTIENGHCGSVNVSEIPSGLKGKCTVGEREFHETLNCSLRESLSIFDYVRATKNRYEESIFHDKTPVKSYKGKAKYLVDGTPTDNLERLKKFQAKKLVEPHEFFYHCKRDIKTHTRITQEGQRKRHFR